MECNTAVSSPDSYRHFWHCCVRVKNEVSSTCRFYYLQLHAYPVANRELLSPTKPWELMQLQPKSTLPALLGCRPVFNVDPR